MKGLRLTAPPRQRRPRQHPLARRRLPLPPRRTLVERGLAVLEFRDGMIDVASPAPLTFQNWMGQ